MSGIVLSPSRGAAIKGLSRLRVLVVALVVAGALAGAVGTTAASANVVQAQNSGTWIWVGTGAKNYWNHTQWVSYITVMTGSYGACPGKLEAWTWGWYAAQPVCGSAAITWYISRWIPSGNAVCGASRNKYGGRDVACIGIRV
jgi:hypothetical protein